MSRHTGFTGSALIRLLAQWAGADARQALPSFADRLSQWLGWADAITLSAALENGAVSTTAGHCASLPSVFSVQEHECQQVRQALARSIVQQSTFDAAPPPSGGIPKTVVEPIVQHVVDFAPYRQTYLGRQHAMAQAIGPLRSRLRAALAAHSPAMARLAALDSVMAQVLAPQEHQLLATVPTLLEQRFRHLRSAASTAVTSDARAWLATFGQDMQAVLLAELALRFQPIEGLLDALRAPASPAP